jgi:hypothetical protein
VRNSLKQLGRGATLFAATSLLMATTAVIPAEAVNKLMQKLKLAEMDMSALRIQPSKMQS